MYITRVDFREEDLYKQVFDPDGRFVGHLIGLRKDDGKLYLQVSLKSKDDVRIGTIRPCDIAYINHAIHLNRTMEDILKREEVVIKGTALLPEELVSMTVYDAEKNRVGKVEDIKKQGGYVWVRIKVDSGVVKEYLKSCIEIPESEFHDVDTFQDMLVLHRTIREILP